MQQLTQQSGFHYRAFVLREDDIYILHKDFKQEREYSVNYLDLGLQFYRKNDHQHRLLNWLAAATFSLCGIAFVLSSLELTNISSEELFYTAGISGLIWLATRLRQTPSTLYLLGGEEQLAFLAEHPSEDALHDFLEELTDRIKDAYQNQYLDDQLDVPAEERRSRIQWLHQMKVLTRSEKDVLLAKLGPSRQQSIGFKRTA